ncbi:MAG: hypothetical protein U1D25_01085 [Hydrogenophaga sp.]|uniref:hypothetical protein n=1 Tax=Hydrogenophaga sp. TaxID=1904254 RepID=UPI002ABB6275|nr:hypothetical protein [Hydrogenophaga sp.]MDZ4186688.1 hypothetical protein [Hydrogenophaga sp.]
MKSLIKYTLLLAFIWSGVWLAFTIDANLSWRTYLSGGLQLNEIIPLLKEIWEPGATFLGSILGLAYYYLESSKGDEKIDDSFSPFEVIELNKLSSAGLLRPMDFEIQKLQSVVRKPTSDRFQIICGGPGVGKTRHAIECIELIAKEYRADIIYVARRYVDEFSAIPKKGSIRKVIVVIDDYDQGYAPSTGNDFMERYSAGGASIANLIALKTKLCKELEVLGMVVTINNHRLPLDGAIARLSECDFSIVDLDELNQTEFSNALSELSSNFNIEMDESIIQTIRSGFDGRLDTLSAFVHEFKGQKVSSENAENFLSKNGIIWEAYRESLSMQQRDVYDIARLLWNSKLNPKIEYFFEMALMPRSLVESIIKSNWPIHNGVVILYDSQFRGSAIGDLELDLVVTAILRGFKSLAKFDRQGFQNDLKCLGQILIERKQLHQALRLLRCAISMFPKDRYFAYLNADAHKQLGGRLHIFLAILSLYRIFRNRKDFWLIFASGKWIEVRARVLLAEIYQDPLIFNEKNFDVRTKIQREYSFALTMVENASKDADIGSYRKLKMDASGVPLEDRDGGYVYDESEINSKEMHHYLSELGLIRSDTSRFDYDGLQAFVYHSMAKYASRCTNSEHLTLKYESLVAQIVPEFGEALLSCADACLSMGNEREAIRYLDMTENCGPKYQPEEVFRLRVAITRSLAYADLGTSDESLIRFNSIKIQAANASIIQIELDKRWDQAKQLNELRDKNFSTSLLYYVKRIKFRIEVPAGWKVSNEFCKLDHDEYFFAGLSSPTEWSPQSRQPGDASVSISYQAYPQYAPRTSVAQYVNDFFENIKAKDPADWFSLSEVKCANGRYFSYGFSTKSVWPKSGCLQIMDHDQARVVFITMCQKNVSVQFAELFDRLRKHFSASLAGI